MTKNYSNALPSTRSSRTVTPQTQAIPGRESEMATNNAGGVTFTLDAFAQLRRFLCLGTEGNTFYVSEQKMTEANAKNVIAAIKADGVRAVQMIVDISKAGRAPTNDPALYALALAMTYGDAATKRAAFAAIPAVARIGTHILHLAEYVNAMRGWGRGLRSGFARWYNDKEPLKLAQQLTKYANRDGWTHRDILRLAHIKPATSTHDALFTDTMGKSKLVNIDADVEAYMSAVEALKSTTNAKTASKLITKFNLPREVVPTELLNEKLVWEALLPHMGMEALVRNLATLTRVGIVGGAFSQGTKDVIAKFSDIDVVRNSRLHPIKVLSALMTYKAGRGVRGNNTWTPDQKIVDALDDLFYATFVNVVPTGKRHLMALDVSGSMGGGEVGGVIGLTPCMAVAAMSMVTVRTEADTEVYGFARTFKDLKITAKDTLSSAMKKAHDSNFGSTDAALAFEWARTNKVKVDAFVVMTDNDTYAGNIQPSQALRNYRRDMNVPDAKCVVVGTLATPFTIADPQDKGMVDFVGFDSSVPSLIADFVRGEF